MNFTINFYLDSKVNRKKERSVYCFIRGLFPKKAVYYNTGVKLNEKYWNKSKQTVRKSHPQEFEINNYLKNFSEEIYKKFVSLNRESKNKLTPKKARKIINDIFKPDYENETNFINIYDRFLSIKKTEISSGTVKRYKTFRNHLLNFSKQKDFNLSFNNFDMSFFDEFKKYCLNELNFNNNTFHKTISFLKTFLNWATDRGYNKKLDYKKFKTREYATEIVYLTWDELMNLLSLDFSKNPRLNKARNIFCFSCFTGQRYSDISRLKLEDVRDDEWLLRTKKTKDINIVPLNRYALDILNKYAGNGLSFPVISNQKLNQYLKELCEIAEIDDKVERTSYRGGKKEVKTYKKYELIGTHTARRTFITLSLEKGMRPEVVMKITGIKDYKTMKKYMAITDTMKKQEMNQIWK